MKTRRDSPEHEQSWSVRLLRARQLSGKAQKFIADRFNVNQSEVSRWESGSRPVPQEVQQFIKQIENQYPNEAPAAQGDIRAEEFCFGAPTFRSVWNESKKKIQRLSAYATIRPTKSDPSKFADVEMRIRFEGVQLPPDDPLYLDCLGVIPELHEEKGRYFFDKADGSDLEWKGRVTPGEANKHLPTFGIVEEVPTAKKAVGPGALAYRLMNVLKDDTIDIEFTAHRGVRSDQIDAIGVPVYGDCPVEFLSLSVTFENLVPWPQKPTAQFYLLRRTLIDSRPLHLVGGLEVVEPSKGKHTFSFQNLRYPRPGFGFCIAWGTLQPVAD